MSEILFGRSHLSRHGMADFLEAGKVPSIGEINALLRLHRLHHAVTALQKDAFTIFFVLE